MTGISFVIVTSGTNDQSLNQIIDSIEALSIPEYEIVIVGGLTSTLNRTNTIHVQFDEKVKPKVWLTRKKNLGVQASKYDIVVIMHDYYVFDPDWYIEFEKFGFNWDICVHQGFHNDEQGGIRANGWRAEYIPGYPEIPYCMTIPWDIDCFIPYMPIQGAYWVAKKQVMLEQPLNENLLMGECDDIEWSSRVVPGWLGQKINQVGYKIVANPKCVTRFNKFKPTYPGNPNWAELERQYQPLWDLLRQGMRKAGVYHYERNVNKVIKGGQ
jgi:hypothetical protein